MKTTSIQQVPQQWEQNAHWLAACEEVQVTENGCVVPGIVPALAQAATPDFPGRAQAIWGESPKGQPWSGVVKDGRGGDT